MGCANSKRDLWLQAEDASGGVYWYNEKTGDVTHVGCDKPRAGETAAQSAERTWLARTDAAGGVYWLNLGTGDATTVGCDKPRA